MRTCKDLQLNVGMNFPLNYTHFTHLNNNKNIQNASFKTIFKNHSRNASKRTQIRIDGQNPTDLFLSLLKNKQNASYLHYTTARALWDQLRKWTCVNHAITLLSSPWHCWMRDLSEARS